MKNPSILISRNQISLFLLSATLGVFVMACEKDNSLQEDLSSNKSKVNQTDDPNDNGNSRLQTTHQDSTPSLHFGEEQKILK